MTCAMLFAAKGCCSADIDNPALALARLLIGRGLCYWPPTSSKVTAGLGCGVIAALGPLQETGAGHSTTPLSARSGVSMDIEGGAAAGTSVLPLQLWAWMHGNSGPFLIEGCFALTWTRRILNRKRTGTHHIVQFSG